MRGIITDSGPFIALFDGSDRFHKQALSFIQALDQPLITNLPVITEVVFMLDFSVSAQRDFLGWAEDAVRIDDRTVTDLPRINEILGKYDDLPADFADASLVSLCERLGIYSIATVDSDFTIYRSKAKKGFSNVFFLDL